MISKLKNAVKKLKSRSKGSERAVSPVIGVILMVAITVILAAVIGTFVLGLGGDLATTPQASFSITDTDTSADTITVEHVAGDALQGDETEVLVIRDPVGASEERDRVDLSTYESTFRNGDVVTLDMANFGAVTDIADDDEITVRFIDKNSDQNIASVSTTV